MKKDFWHYVLKLTIEDFKRSATKEQFQEFVEKYPKFNFKPSYQELYIDMMAWLERLVQYMKKEQIGYFGKVQA